MWRDEFRKSLVIPDYLATLPPESTKYIVKKHYLTIHVAYQHIRNLHPELFENKVKLFNCNNGPFAIKRKYGYICWPFIGLDLFFNHKSVFPFTKLTKGCRNGLRLFILLSLLGIIYLYII